MKSPVFALVFGGAGVVVALITVVRWWSGDSGAAEAVLGLLFSAPFMVVGVWTLGLYERFGWDRRRSDALFGGSLAILMGLVVFVAMAQSPRSSFNVSPWVAYVGASVFPIAGVLIIVTTLWPGDRALVRLLSALLTTGMAVVAWAVTFDATGATVSIAGWTMPAGWSGSVAFGIGAALTSAIAVCLWIGTVKSFSGPGGSAT